MCPPAAIMAAMAIGSGVMQYQGAKQQAKGQDAIFEQNRLNALQSMRDQQNAIGLRTQQENAAATEEMQARRLQSLRETSSANAAAGEAGVSGFSVERVLRDMSAVASRDISTIDQNRDWNIQQLNSEAAGIRTATQSRINSVQKGVKPNPWSHALRAGVDAGGAYAAGGGDFAKLNPFKK